MLDLGPRSGGIRHDELMYNEVYRCRAGPRVQQVCFFFSSRRRHTRCSRDWSSDVCSSDLVGTDAKSQGKGRHDRKTGRFAKHAQAEAQILEKAVDEIYATRLAAFFLGALDAAELDRKSTRLNSSHGYISYAVFCLKKKKKQQS